MDPTQPGLPVELIEHLIAELGAELARPPTDIHIDSVQPVTWRDGSLGCPEPGMSYTQALVPGFRIILVVDGRRFDYRTGRGGTFRRCERSFDQAGETADQRPTGADATT
jgi:hypothetical protein